MKSEIELYPLWQSFCRSGRKSSCGRLQGIDAGELNYSEGPDFKNAVFMLDNIRHCGDVEVHIRSRDWYTHGHQYDNRYDRVMLHLVWSPSATDDQSIMTSSGRKVPSISIRNFPPVLVPSVQIARCRSVEDRPTDFTSKVRKIIQQRLTGLGRQLHHIAGEKQCDQAIYEGILRILGSPQNMQNFLWIAQKLTWKSITDIKHRFFLTEKEWFVIFLNAAGLICSRRNFAEFCALSDRFSHIVPKTQLNRPMWKLAGQRPAHSPIRRLAGLAVFVRSFPASSLYNELRELFYARHPYKIIRARLHNLLQPEVTPDLKLLLMHDRRRKLWGQDMISEINGNVTIPFFYYMAKKNGSTGFKDYLESIYYQLPLHNRYSCLLNFFQWPEVKKLPPNKFYLQQALLQIRQNFCLNNGCQTCFLNRIAESR